MPKSAKEIATELEEAWSQGPLKGIKVLGSMAADKINVTHVPPVSIDGIMDGKAWAESMQQLYEGTLQRTISGFEQKVTCTVNGDVIQSANIFKGTLKDGTRLNHCVDGLMTVKGGKIVNAVTIYNDERESWASLVKAMDIPAA